MKFDLYKTQIGFYELRNGNVIFCAGFGCHSGWGINLTVPDASLYVWTTDDGCCEYKDDVNPQTDEYDIVEYLGKTVPNNDVIHKKPISVEEKTLKLLKEALDYIEQLEIKYGSRQDTYQTIKNEYKILKKNLK